MQLVRTTLRLKTHLKKEAQRQALEENTTLQDIFNQALAEHLKKKTKKRAREIIFKTHSLGVNLDNLTRDDFYN